ncbi:hypothetical protein G4H71_21345 [Rhodococcus triatomae]|uniref:Uncharacterized protein n=1 Tax=Rhodococcus triatomae TaxID=300028 RepID=A0A1G8K6C9_9NOCA|nr:DMT family transporter [Rhodococcus triatomae]QNG18837.1 hypothetical protein G4H72_09030 [Rhodococcus triatomae]QNG25252.1 hypothetical protein G4H71_21345 [Rhodococcus triatomae]SDI38994.1 hypothetical protein SAMN05444695_10738 [Rhodococcus triatomae]
MEAGLAAIACALLAALLAAVGAVAQQKSAESVPDSGPLLARLIRAPRWWAGVVGDGGSYVVQAVALALGSVLVVQPLLVASLLFALPLSARWSGVRVSARAWGLAVALAVALAVFLVVGDPTEGGISAPAERWALPLAGVLAVVVAATVVGSLRIGAQWRALLLGTAAGALYGVAVAFTKYVVDRLEHGVIPLVSSWQTWALVAAGVTGFYLQQKAFQVGPLSASLPALTIAEPLAAVFLGISVLGERLQTGDLGFVVVGLAVVVMLVTTLGLSRARAEVAEEGEERESPVP